MSFVAAGTFIVGDVAAASMGALATGMIGGALVGAGTGALVNGLTGRSVLNGALIGGAIGAGGGALGGAFAGAGAAGETGMIAADASSQLAAGIPASQVSSTLASSYSMTAAQADAAVAAAQGSSAASTAAQAAAPTVAKEALTAPAQAPVQAAGTAPPSSSLMNQYANMNVAPGDTPVMPGTVAPQGTGPGGNTYGTDPNSIQGYLNSAGRWVSQNKGLTAAGLGAAYLATRPNAFKANYLPTYTPPSAQSYGLGRTMSSNYQPTFAAAEGGIARLAAGGPTTDFMATGGAYPMSQQVTPQYATPSQMPTSAQSAMASYEPNTNPLTGEQTGFANGGITRLAAGGTPAPIATSASPTINTPIQTVAGLTGLQQAQKQSQAQPVTMDYINSLASQYGVSVPTVGVKSAAKGGSMGGEYNLGSYSDGGRLLKGPGDGMSDNIPASIANKQPARLADSEFVVPADVVSHLGNGSTDAGAKHLYKMMDQVRKARTGRKKQSPAINAEKYIPKALVKHKNN